MSLDTYASFLIVVSSVLLQLNMGVEFGIRKELNLFLLAALCLTGYHVAWWQDFAM